MTSNEETVGELYERLPDDEWIYLPEYDVEIRRWNDEDDVHARECEE